MIIDTNVYSALDNGHSTAVNAVQAQKALYLPVIVVGELRFGFSNGERRQENEQRLDRFLAQQQVEILPLSLETTHAYAELATHCRNVGRALTNNDLWIAALASQHDLTLATFDKDFSAVENILGDNLKLLS